MLRDPSSAASYDYPLPEPLSTHGNRHAADVAPYLRPWSDNVRLTCEVRCSRLVGTIPGLKSSAANSSHPSNMHPKLFGLKNIFSGRIAYPLLAHPSNGVTSHPLIAPPTTLVLTNQAACPSNHPPSGGKSHLEIFQVPDGRQQCRA